jgi:16S rRNA (uracil1498-N3)-methyltransferase
MPVYYTPRIEAEEAILGEAESRHVIRVLRMSRGDPLEIVDGRGNYYEGHISHPDPKACRVRIGKVVRDHLPRDYYLHIAIAPPKSTDRFEWFLEKATEIGVDEISPLICERSERNRIRLERSQNILMAAMKQSGRAWLPKLNRESKLNDFLDRSNADIRLIAHCKTDHGHHLREKPQKDLSWIILVGPEGDFAPDEIIAARQKGYTEINLGEAVYRTETAGIMACHTISLLYQNRP